MAVDFDGVVTSYLLTDCSSSYCRRIWMSEECVCIVECATPVVNRSPTQPIAPQATNISSVCLEYRILETDKTPLNLRLENCSC